MASFSAARSASMTDCVTLASARNKLKHLPRKFGMCPSLEKLDLTANHVRLSPRYCSVGGAV